MVEAEPKFVANKIFLLTAGVTSVSWGKSFKVLDANFRFTQIEPCPQQDIAKASRHPANLMESPVFHGKHCVSLPPNVRMESSQKGTVIQRTSTPSTNTLLTNARAKWPKMPTMADDIKVKVPKPNNDQSVTCFRSMKICGPYNLARLRPRNVEPTSRRTPNHSSHRSTGPNISQGSLNSKKSTEH